MDGQTDGRGLCGQFLCSAVLALRGRPPCLPWDHLDTQNLLHDPVGDPGVTLWSPWKVRSLQRRPSLLLPSPGGHVGLLRFLGTGDQWPQTTDNLLAERRTWWFSGARGRKRVSSSGPAVTFRQPTPAPWGFGGCCLLGPSVVSPPPGSLPASLDDWEAERRPHGLFGTRVPPLAMAGTREACYWGPQGDWARATLRRLALLV